MGDWSLWVILTCPVYLALTGRLTGIARFRALWAYCWLIAAFMAFNAWHFAAAWHALAPPGYLPLPRQVTAYRETLWAHLALTVAVLALPFLLYPNERRGARDTGASHPAA